MFKGDRHADQPTRQVARCQNSNQNSPSKTETKYLYSYNDGSWSTSLNFNNLDLLKQVSGMSPDQVVYIQLQSEGCVVALSRASGITRLPLFAGSPQDREAGIESGV